MQLAVQVFQVDMVSSLRVSIWLRCGSGDSREAIVVKYSNRIATLYCTTSCCSHWLCIVLGSRNVYDICMGTHKKVSEVGWKEDETIMRA